MTRMIERWFPCAEVSVAAEAGWGSGDSEKSLFTWFAARPLAQARAAVLTSLLPWPEDHSEQRRLQGLVRRALLGGYDDEYDTIIQELARAFPMGATILDPFSGRAMIPLEAAHYGIKSWGIDYSPVATLAGQLLADYPLMDWAAEPTLPYDQPARTSTFAQIEAAQDRLLRDVEVVLNVVGERFAQSVSEFYPQVDGRQPWGYLWAMALPCLECGRRFPLTGSLLLRPANPRRRDPGQSYRIMADHSAGTIAVTIHEGPPVGQPTLVNPVRGGRTVKGKLAICPFCDHPHRLEVHQRMAGEGLGTDMLLVAADVDPDFGKAFRGPTEAEREGASLAAAALATEVPFDAGLPAAPTESIPQNNGATIRPQLYGARNYGDLCNPRQTLAFVRLARTINIVGQELLNAGLTTNYVACLTGYAAAVLVRKLRRATRGATLDTSRASVHDIFVNETSIAFSYDYFEVGLGESAGTWPSLAKQTLSILRKQMLRRRGRPAVIRRGSATVLPLRDATVDAVVTDPPYDAMVYYTDCSDLAFVWLKRALLATHPDLGVTTDPRGLQEKDEELIVKQHGIAPGEHRTREHYDEGIARSFAEARRVVRNDGVVTIVFGHGEPEVWNRLLKAITAAGLVLTGSWPAKTESGGQQGKANIVTTVTMSCRPAPANRPAGRLELVDDEVRREVRERIPLWERADLALIDQLMAAAGPAMEVVGRYSEVRDNRGKPVDPSRYLVLARRAVLRAADIKIEEVSLETFDVRTRFALTWSRLYGRSLAPKSEARWDAMATDLSYSDLKGVLVEAEKGKGVRLAFSTEVQPTITPESALIDLALALARARADGLEAVADTLARGGRTGDDEHLWSAMSYLASRLPEADPDRIAWMSLIRDRRVISAAGRSTNLAVQQGDLFAVASQREDQQ